MLIGQIVRHAYGDTHHAGKTHRSEQLFSKSPFEVTPLTVSLAQVEGHNELLGKSGNREAHILPDLLTKCYIRLDCS